MDRDNRDKRWNSEADELEQRRRSRRGKSGWRRPRRILGLWARLGLLLGVIVVTVFLAIGLVTKAARPYREASIQSRQLSETQSQSDALMAQNADLARQIRYLKTPDGIASEARSYGYLRPGERPLMVKGLEQPALVSVAPPVPPPTPTGAARRFWRHLTGH